MTYDEWLKTERQHNDMSEVENTFGYTPEGSYAKAKKLLDSILAKLAEAK